MLSAVDNREGGSDRPYWEIPSRNSVVFAAKDILALVPAVDQDVTYRRILFSFTVAPGRDSSRATFRLALRAPILDLSPPEDPRSDSSLATSTCVDSAPLAFAAPATDVARFEQYFSRLYLLAKFVRGINCVI